MKQESPYKNHYLIYTRKSTDDSVNQKNSISYQKMETLRYAKRERLLIAPTDIVNFCSSGIIIERHTGFKEGKEWLVRDNGTVQFMIERPKFHRLVQLLQQGKFKGVIFLCWDRASRNETDDNILHRLMKRGIDILFVQANYDKSSAGALHMDIDGMFSHHYSRVISEKVRGTTRKLRGEGICTYRAPIGYLNLGNPREKPFDAKRAPIIKRLFEKYAREHTSLNELARWANSQGLTMRPVRRRRTEAERLADEDIIITPAERPVTFKNIQKILCNPFYIGKILGNDGQWVKSTSHEPLVSEMLFQAVQKKLKAKQTSVTYDLRLVYPYRGLFRCAFCERVFTPYEQKNRVYYGARCDKCCQNSVRNFGQKHLEYLVGERLAGLHFQDAEIAIIEQMAYKSSLLQEEYEKEQLRKQRQREKLQGDLAYMRDNKITLLKSGVYSPEEFLKEEAELTRKLKQTNTANEPTDVKTFTQTLILFSELSKSLNLYYHLAKPEQKEQIISLTFSELRLSGNTLKTKGKDAFRIFESPFVALGDPKGWLSELVTLKGQIEPSIAEIEHLLNGFSKR